MMRRFLCPRQWLLFTPWVLANIVGVAMGTLAMFLLYGNLHLVRYSDPKDWVNLLSGLAICGAAQGLILASSQTTVLLIAKLASMQKIVQWFSSTIVSMMIGMTLPNAYVLLLNSSENSLDRVYTASKVGWILSWWMAGLLWGAIAGQYKQQKIDWGFINAGAYLVWGIAVIYIFMLAVSILDAVPGAIPLPSFSSGDVLFVAVMWGIGIGLNGLIFQQLIHRQRRRLG